MKEQMIKWVVGMFLERMSSEDLKVWADMGLDMLEDAVDKSENKFDDAIVLPMIKLFREAFQIEDND